MGFQRCANESVKGKLPVLFHIHGGAFEEGSGGNFGPHFLMDECVVHVTINYRLGALGEAGYSTQDVQNISIFLTSA